MALQEFDRDLIERCLAHRSKAWEAFVDRFMGLVVHVVNHSASARSIRLGPEDREDLCAEVFLAIVRDDFGVLRRFRGQSSRATYLTVVARRVVVRELLGRKSAARLTATVAQGAARQDVSPHLHGGASDSDQDLLERFHDRDEVERLLDELEGQEAELIRLYHLDGKSYREISSALGVAENSVGPALSRARDKLRRAGSVSRE